MKPKRYETIAAALDEEAWDWLATQYPGLADALLYEVEQGATDDGIHLFTLCYAGSDRDLLAKRLQLAARHLQREEN